MSCKEKELQLDMHGAGIVVGHNSARGVGHRHCVVAHVTELVAACENWRIVPLDILQ